MRLFNRKSQLQRVLDTVSDSLDVPARIKPPSGRRARR